MSREPTGRGAIPPPRAAEPLGPLPAAVPPPPAPRPLPREQNGAPLDDYQIIREADTGGPSAGTRLLRVLAGFVLIVLAAISLALCWVLLMLLHVI